MRGATDPTVAPAHLALVDDGVHLAQLGRLRPAEPRSDGTPRLIRFAELARVPLDRGRGSVRDIWTSVNPDRSLRWQLRVVELRDSAGLLVAPEGTMHAIVGFAGPQVEVRVLDASRPLHRDEVLRLDSATVSFSRPRLRASGASSVIVLSHAATADPPRFAFQDLDTHAAGIAAGAGGLRILLALQTPLHLGTMEAPRGSAVIVT